jgi:hypothetical protein
MNLRPIWILRVAPLNNERTLVVTYNVPELLKVGSAQALVLDTCDLNPVVLNGCTLGFDSAYIPEQYASCRDDNLSGEPPSWETDLLVF